jgi:hypothetical protein
MANVKMMIISRLIPQRVRKDLRHESGVLVEIYLAKWAAG